MLVGIVVVVVAVVAVVGLRPHTWRPGALSDSQQITSALRSYEYAISVGDGSAACSYMTPLAQARMVALGSLGPLHLGRTCAGVLTKVGALQARLLRDGLRPQANADAVLQAKLGPVEFDPRHMIATAYPFGRETTFWRWHGRWLMSSSWHEMDETTPIKPAPKAVSLTPAASEFQAAVTPTCWTYRFRLAPTMAARAPWLEGHAAPPRDVAAILRAGAAVDLVRIGQLTRLRVSTAATPLMQRYIGELRATVRMDQQGAAVADRKGPAAAKAFYLAASRRLEKDELPDAVQAADVC